MSDELVIHGFETSNNFKVRAALGFKGIDYRFVTIDPKDRSGMVEISGQPFTPVMTHGDVVMFDSAAILRYLEANFPDTPKLFSDDYGTMRAIEKWEFFGRVDLHEPLGIMVRQRIAGTSDPEATARAAQAFADRTAELEKILSNQEWLAHTRLTAADITCACVVHRVKVMNAFDVPDERPAVYAWTDKVMSFDRGPDA
ncbi:MAG: glutathione S-transferase family protein [Acidobacteriota bacterium]|jgi:glutathione S-transferase